MNKIAILYYSNHYGNTKSVLDAIQSYYHVDLIELPLNQPIDLSNYIAVGLASGVYNGIGLHKSLFDIIKNDYLNPQTQTIFIIYTSALGRKQYGRKFIQVVENLDFQLLGTYHCKGFSDARLFKLKGGVAIGHPNLTDRMNACHFFESCMRQLKMPITDYKK